MRLSIIFRRGRVRASFFLLLFLAGCAPVITHGPRVEPGRSFGAVGGWRAGLCDSGCTAGLVPPIGLYLNEGFTTREGSGPAYSLGVFVPVGILAPAAHLDLYVQAPAPPEQRSVYGGGLSASFGHLMPYVQAGSLAPDGRGWYTTQGVVLANYRPEPEVFLNGGRGTVFEDVASVYWSPTLAYQLSGASVFVSGAFGSEETVEYDPQGGYEASGHRPVRTLMVGVSVGTRPSP
ncbi:MAG: hypothetical protein ICV87_03045 [Gemmatimonadetes bacterium]|nr:hypothetical protein [Gemmatimonadota bacterium]